VVRRAFGLALGWLLIAAVIWLSLTPSPPKLEVAYGDKLGHFAAYGALMVWFCQFYGGRRARLVCAVGFIGMGIGLEFIQRMTGYRDFEWLDMVADAVGVLLGWAAAGLLRTARISL
jgi:VanZ family protein